MDARMLAEIEELVRRNLEANPTHYDEYHVSRDIADAYDRGFADALDSEYGTEDDRPQVDPHAHEGQPEQSPAVYTVMDEDTHRLRRMSRLEIEELRRGTPRAVGEYTPFSNDYGDDEP